MQMYSLSHRICRNRVVLPLSVVDNSRASYFDYPFSKNALMMTIIPSFPGTAIGYGGFYEQMSQAGCLYKAEKRMKVHFSCNIIYFGRLSKEVASTASRRSRMEPHIRVR